MHVTLYSYNGDEVGRLELVGGEVVPTTDGARLTFDINVGLDGERVLPSEGERYLRAVHRSLPRSALVE